MGEDVSVTFVKIREILQTDVLREITMETCDQTKLSNQEIIVVVLWKNGSIGNLQI